MRDFAFPVRGYDGPIDWGDLDLDFCGSGLLHMGGKRCDVARRVAGQMAFLAVPYAELTTGRALAAQVAAQWRADLLRDVVCISPAVDAEALLYMGLTSVNPADDPTDWLGLVRRYLRFADLVVVPPVEGWDQSREVYQIAAAALNSNRQVYVLSRGGCGMSAHSPASRSRSADPKTFEREKFFVGHVLFEVCDHPKHGATFALIAGEATEAKHLRPLFTGFVQRGMGTALRRLAHRFDELEAKLAKGADDGS